MRDTWVKLDGFVRVISRGNIVHLDCLSSARALFPWDAEIDKHYRTTGSERARVEVFTRLVNPVMMPAKLSISLRARGNGSSHANERLPIDPVLRFLDCAKTSTLAHWLPVVR